MSEKDSYRAEVVMKKIGGICYLVVSPMPLDPDVFSFRDRVRVTVKKLKRKSVPERKEAP